MVFARIAKLKASDQKNLILNSELFDPDWYAKQLGLKGGARKALRHFLKWRGVHDPSVRFSSGAYLFDNPDVRTARLNPLLHYLRYGIDEGRTAKDIYGRISGAAEPMDDQSIARLRGHFDQAFYAAANPDLKKEDDLFSHFMRVGWRQNRDPAPWFSIKDYLRDNSLVGKNPFVHYVLSGASLGCRKRDSQQALAKCCSQARPGKRPHIAVVAMVRNEADIIELFTSHLLALFDEIIVVDHQSDDGTAAFLAALADRFPQVRVLKLCEPSYIQSITMTHVTRDIPSLRRADWLFFLDADEFLPFQTRDAFHRALEEYGECPIISMRWRNVVPADYGSDVFDIETTQFFLPPAFSPFKKIAFQPSRLNVDQTEVAQGNHALVDTLSGAELRAFEAKFHLVHIPIRSDAQLAQKLKQGVRSYQLLGQTRDQEQGMHWHRMTRATSMRNRRDEHLNAMAVNYSEDGQSMVPMSRQDLLDLGYTNGALSFAREHTGLKALRPIRSGETMAPQFAPRDVQCATRLRTCRNGDLVRADDLSPEVRLKRA